MPFYDLHCVNCGKDANIRASVAEKEDKRIVCPACGSNHLETIYKPVNFQVKNNEPSACPNRHICGSGCHHS